MLTVQNFYSLQHNGKHFVKVLKIDDLGRAMIMDPEFGDELFFNPSTGEGICEHAEGLHLYPVKDGDVEYDTFDVLWKNSNKHVRMMTTRIRVLPGENKEWVAQNALEDSGEWIKTGQQEGWLRQPVKYTKVEEK